jgi:heme/copper-type cytochrome/quinol oxidase subunit 1
MPRRKITTSTGLELMNWEAIGAVSALIGAIAVVASLVYLAFQIRQNTKQLEQSERTAIAASLNVSATNYRENRHHIYTNADVAEIYLKGAADPESLGEIELYRYRLLMSNFVDANWDIYVQTVATGFSPETWESQASKAIERVLGTPGGRWFWENYCTDYPKDFRQEIDSLLNPHAQDN